MAKRRGSRNREQRNQARRRAGRCQVCGKAGRLEVHRAGPKGALSGGNALELYDGNGNSRITCAEARANGIAPVPREDVRSPLKTWQVCHRDLGKALTFISGHLRRSKNDLRDGQVQESFFLTRKLGVKAFSFS